MSTISQMTYRTNEQYSDIHVYVRLLYYNDHLRTVSLLLGSNNDEGTHTRLLLNINDNISLSVTK